MLSKSVIRTENLCKRVQSPEGTLSILEDINFSIEPSQTVSIVGTSGSGKSTLLGILAGLDLPTEGRVFFDDLDITQLNEDGRAQARADQVGFIFQSFQLLPSLTALENVMLPLELGNHHSVKATATQELDRVGLSHRLHHYPNQLSGGEQQRVAIARAFVCRPKILFADEPTGNLDHHTSTLIKTILFALRAEYGTTLVIVTHDVTFAQTCDRLISLEAGQLIETSKP